MKRWIFHSPTIDDLPSELASLPKIFVRLLANRGLTTADAIKRFLHPSYDEHLHDPWLFRDMEKAVARIITAINGNQGIRIYGDYDVDGVSALAVLYTTFRALAVEKVSVGIPDRYKDGYGLNPDAIQTAAADGVQLLITCDCGTSNVNEIDLANSLGIDVIVVDHHKQPPVLPAAYAFLNPAFPDEPYPWKKLCSGGVAFKLASALLQKMDYGAGRLETPLPRGWEKWLLDFVALSTVADMMPLLDENRTLVKHGLTVLKKTRSIGLQELAKVMGISLDDVDAGTIGFQIAPRLNAAGRLKHANAAFTLLTTEDPAVAADLARDVHQTNAERQRLTATIFQEAMDQLDGRMSSKLIVARGKGWSSGVIGLVAGKLKEVFHRPVLAIGEDDGKIVGSGRSVPGFDITAALVESRDHLVKYGGHPMACGFTVHESKTDDFIQQMTAIAERELAEQDLQPELYIDGELGLDEMTWDLVHILEQLEPYGIAVPEPIFVTRKLKVLLAERVGKEGKHLRLRFADAENRIGRAIGFGMGEWADRLTVGEVLDIAFRLGVNEWNGNRSIQMTMVDVQPSIS